MSEDVEVSEEREHGVRERARVALRGRVDHEGRTRPVAPPVVVQQRDGRHHPPRAERRTHRLAHVVDALLEDPIIIIIVCYKACENDEVSQR